MLFGHEKDLRSGAKRGGELASLGAPRRGLLRVRLRLLDLGHEAQRRQPARRDADEAVRLLMAHYDRTANLIKDTLADSIPVVADVS